MMVMKDKGATQRAANNDSVDHLDYLTFVSLSKCYDEFFTWCDKAPLLFLSSIFLLSMVVAPLQQV